MSANALLTLLTQALFFAIFLLTAAQAMRRPLRANIEVAALFGTVAIITAVGWFTRAFDITPHRYLTAFNGAALMSLPYLLLRLVDVFSSVPRWLMRAAEAGLAASVVALFVFPAPTPLVVVVPLVLYFVALQAYDAAKFVIEARRTSGLTCRRMQCVAFGAVSLGLLVLWAGLVAAAPRLSAISPAVSSALALASGVAYFFGFTPPKLLRLAWQAPELRAFLSRVASLPRLPDADAVVQELERGAASVVGAPRALLARLDPATNMLVSRLDGEVYEHPADAMPGGWAFTTQRPMLTVNAPRDDPANADVYRRFNVRAILAAPVTAGATCLGALVVYAPREPVFAEDDLALVQLVADQAAVVLEARRLIEEAARVQAREEATRLKDDFLSAAAHDLKTPLTTLAAQAQFMERRALREPAAPADIEGIRRIVRESRRLNRLVVDLLEASRVEYGHLVGRREPVDLVELAQDACVVYGSDRHPCTVIADKPVIGNFDRVRMAQLFENLLSNAVKFSPAGGAIEIRVARDGETAVLSVRDHGIGIATADLPHIFERFQRGANVDDRRFAGMGLGLFLCRGIVEQHGGRIEACSRPGAGSVFHITLPLDGEVGRDG